MVSKVSEITIEDVAKYIRATDDDNSDIATYLNIAKHYISSYTGIPIASESADAETLDTYADFVIVVFILCQDMYDNRTMYVESDKVNRVVQTILDMHSRNLL